MHSPTVWHLLSPPPPLPFQAAGYILLPFYKTQVHYFRVWIGHVSRFSGTVWSRAFLGAKLPSGNPSSWHSSLCGGSNRCLGPHVPCVCQFCLGKLEGTLKRKNKLASGGKLVSWMSIYHSLEQRCLLKAAVRTDYKFDSSKKLLCPDDDDPHFYRRLRTNADTEAELFTTWFIKF